MTARQTAIDAARAAVKDGRFEAALSGLVACPSASQGQAPDTTQNLKLYLEKEILPRLTAMGFTCTIHDTDAQPILIARRIEDPALPTVLSYGHGDTVHLQQDSWSDGLSPLHLTRRGDKLYGRGSADNKAQHLINMMAQEAVIATRGKLGFNAIWLLEMGEEMGSPGLGVFCEAHKQTLSADVLIASDGPRLRPEQPTIFLGARGALNFELHVEFRDGAHHSGNWGGLIADPAMVLAQALSTITDSRGSIRVPEWRPDSLTPEIRALLGRLPAPSGGPEIDPNWGEPGLTPAERAYGWNSFAVLALHAGRPEAPVNAIAGRAYAVCQLRFVVGTDPYAVLPALRRHLDREGFGRVRIKEPERLLFPATRSDPENPWVRRIAASVEATCKTSPDILPNLAGSLPNHVFSETLGVPTVWVPHSYGGCNQHAPDEHVLLSVCEQALSVMTGIFWDIGTT